MLDYGLPHVVASRHKLEITAVSVHLHVVADWHSLRTAVVLAHPHTVAIRQHA